MDKPELFIIKTNGVHSLGTQSSQANKQNLQLRRHLEL